MSGIMGENMRERDKLNFVSEAIVQPPLFEFSLNQNHSQDWDQTQIMMV